MNKKYWDYDAADSSTWAHGDYWTLVSPDPKDPEHLLTTVGFAIICPKELIPEILHRHHYLFKKGIDPSVLGWVFDYNNDLRESPLLECDARLFKGEQLFFSIKDGEIHVAA